MAEGGREGDQAKAGQWNIALQLLKAFVCQQDRQYVGYKTNDFHFQHWNVPLSTHSLVEMVSYGWLRANRMQLHKSPLPCRRNWPTQPCHVFHSSATPTHALTQSNIFSYSTWAIHVQIGFSLDPSHVKHRRARVRIASLKHEEEFASSK